MKMSNVCSALLLSAGLLFSTLISAAETDTGAVNRIAVQDVQHISATEGAAIIVDVRTPAEFEMSHLPDAVNLDVQDDDFKELAAMLDRDKTYIVHCTKNPADGRASAALETLQELGFRNLYSLEGGYIAWKDAGLPLVDESSP